MSEEDCDVKIYDRLTLLERSSDRTDERTRHVEKFAHEIRQDIKDLTGDVKELSKKVTVSEVRLIAVIGVLVWVANRFIHR